MFKLFGSRQCLLPLTCAIFTHKIVEASPTFEGIPVGATLLIFQSLPVFEAKFKDKLVVSPSFSPGKLNHNYFEKGFLIPNACVVEIPVYEKLEEEEEKRLGKLLIEKLIVGHLVVEGVCKLGCASVTMRSVKLFKVDANQKPTGEPIWEYHAK